MFGHVLDNDLGGVLENVSDNDFDNVIGHVLDNDLGDVLDNVTLFRIAT